MNTKIGIALLLLVAMALCASCAGMMSSIGTTPYPAPPTPTTPPPTPPSPPSPEPMPSPPSDSDGDGVADRLDACPNSPQFARVDASGCPIELMEPEGSTAGSPSHAHKPPTPSRSPASTAGETPSPVPSAPSTVDAILAKLELGNIAFNAPSKMRVDETAHMKLVLDKRMAEAELKGLITDEGEKVSARIKVSDRMQALLTGPNFDIAPLGAQQQAVSGVEPTTWEWDVIARKEGHQRLHLTLSVFVTVDGVSTPRVIRSFDKEIDVEVTWGQRANTVVGKQWQWLWTAILVPAGGWWWKKRKGAPQMVADVGGPFVPGALRGARKVTKPDQTSHGNLPSPDPADIARGE